MVATEIEVGKSCGRLKVEEIRACTGLKVELLKYSLENNVIVFKKTHTNLAIIWHILICE